MFLVEQGRSCAPNVVISAAGRLTLRAKGWISTLLLTLSVPAALALGLAQPEPDEPLDPLASELESRLELDIQPLLDTHCMHCHRGSRAKGGVRLDTLGDIDSIIAQSEDLRYAREMVSTGQMPPEDEIILPTEHERLTIVQWLDDALNYTPPEGRIDPGWMTIHRLNRDEYQNTLRDLLEIDISAHDLVGGLPLDDVGYGYDNIADVLTMSPTHMEAYLDAAEKAVEIALGPMIEIGNTPRPMPRIQRQGNGRPLRQGGQFFTTNGALRSVVEIPIPGEYEISVLTWGTQGGDDLPNLTIRVDGNEVLSRGIAAESEAEAQRVAVSVKLDAGAVEVSAHFTNDFWVPNVADRNLAIDALSIAGPLTEESVTRPALYRKLIAGREPGRAHAEELADWLLPRAYRRPPEPAERAALLGLYDAIIADGETHEFALRQMLTGVLVSPSFLYRRTEHPEPTNPQLVYELNDHELASRLSYFLWSSMPDDELRELAARGALRNDDTLRAQVRRMLDDPKSDALVRNFAGQWLLLRNLPMIDIDREIYPEFSENLRTDMETEARLFFGDVLRSGRPIGDLIDAQDVFVNERLADLYGIDGVEGDSFRRVSLNDSSSRGGILTLGATLLVTSNPTRTSPVKRGLYVLEHILGTPPPPPPPDIPRLETSAEGLGEAATLRQQLAAHLTDASCVTCHQRMDPIGLAMENFNAIGAWRDAYDDAPIDTFGVLPGGVEFDGPAGLKAILMDRLDAFREHLTSEMLTYAIGRGAEPFDRPAIRKISDETRESDDKLEAMIESIVLSGTFRTCRGREAK